MHRLPISIDFVQSIAMKQQTNCNCMYAKPATPSPSR